MGDRDDFKKKVLIDKTARDEFVLFWKVVAGPEVEAFSYFQE